MIKGNPRRSACCSPRAGIILKYDIIQWPARRYYTGAVYVTYYNIIYTYISRADVYYVYRTGDNYILLLLLLLHIGVYIITLHASSRLCGLTLPGIVSATHRCTPRQAAITLVGQLVNPFGENARL